MSFVAAVVATFGRPREIERLFASLAGIDLVVVCDNSALAEVRDTVKRSRTPAEYVAPTRNLGCGGGLRTAEQRAWEVGGDRLTHLLVLDDDAVLQPDTVEILADVMALEHAVAAYPLITGPSGSVGWTPGLRDRHLHRLGDKEVSPSSYRRRFGNEVADFDWAQGICLLVSRDAIDSAGFHRDDFWVRGEDIDFSLKMTAQGRGIFAPQAQAQHLPPESVGGSATGEYLRHAAMVQNIAFLAFTQAHGKRLRGSVPGAARRFIKLWGIRALRDLARAIWRGAKGEPAGAGHGRTFQRRFDELA